MVSHDTMRYHASHLYGIAFVWYRMVLSHSTSYGGRLAMMQCVQEAGDILMVPDGWCVR
jgi:hypothetical protein